MKPPREVNDDTAAASEKLEEISSALRTGRLVELLRGKGLNKGTVGELLMPDSAANLRAILTDHVSSRRRERAAGAGHEPGQLRPEGGKVLAYRAKETSKP